MEETLNFVNWDIHFHLPDIRVIQLPLADLRKVLMTRKRDETSDFRKEAATLGQKLNDEHLYLT
ncbi:hypothetical protein ACTXT7_016994 [Hymenolepis weldensis]